ncbi:twin-arginine translocase TatA/TatE family subunit [Kaistia terrae]|jgi:sec-independent protein translocase protein TatA|uniref:Sec-independent protein translocase protein TatA n=1 Tax=Kaistia terrae TaxID=537017 RepID=A0ABW0PU68_9HYPH|nr:twin-arginine translocase TatA/TatE family subunit [Kaistia terrae]MCX5577374.1 twin-arginine translocase TatA/TatE family subunit [Kaistia terrae]
MGSFSIWHWLIVLVIVLLLFGKGKISDVMGDMAKGVKSFKKGLADEDEPVAKPSIDSKPSDVVSSNTDEKTRAS